MSQLTSWFGTLMEWLNAYLGNYGWSIVVFTVLFRLALTPLDYYQRNTMRKQSRMMARISPKLDALKKKYQNDPNKLNQKQMELYKKENVSPFAGCLPMIFILVLQFPIFIAFFNVIRNLAGEQIYEMYELAASGEEIAPYAFLWVRNLWQPDTFTATIFPTEGQLAGYTATQNITDYAAVMTPWVEKFAGFRNGWGILPLAAAGFSLLQSTMAQQSSAQENSQAQNNAGNNKMMTWMMPVMSLFFCWTSSAAFALYWTTSSIMAVLSQLAINLIFKMQDKKAAAAEVTATVEESIINE